MSGSVITLMLIVSISLGAFGLMALLWGLKTGQFDDYNKFAKGALNDSEEDLRDAARMDEKKKEAIKKRKEKNYSPPD